MPAIVFVPIDIDARYLGSNFALLSAQVRCCRSAGEAIKCVIHCIFGHRVVISTIGDATLLGG